MSSRCRSFQSMADSAGPSEPPSAKKAKQNPEIFYIQLGLLSRQVLDSVEVRATDLIHKLYTRAVTSLRAPVTLMLGTSILHSKSTVAACNLHDRDWVNVVRDSRARIYSTPYAFAALSVNGSVATWGCPDSGGDSSAVAYLLTSRVRTVASNGTTRRGAFAALTNDGAVVTWGHRDCGGLGSEQLGWLLADNITDVIGGGGAFAATRRDGSVVVWGTLNDSYDLGPLLTFIARNSETRMEGASERAPLLADGAEVRTSAIASVLRERVNSVVWCPPGFPGRLTDVFPIHSYAAVRVDGTVVTRDRTRTLDLAGDIPFATMDLAGVQTLVAGICCFAALRQDGSVVTWGDCPPDEELDQSGNIRADLDEDDFQNVLIVGWWGNGGDCSAVRRHLANGVKSVVASGGGHGSAFAALKSNGAVITWGSARHGGDSSIVHDQLQNGVISSVGSRGAFAALKGDGSVVTWREGPSGGNSSYVQSYLCDGVEAIAATAAAFAALKVDGSIVTWGLAKYGGDSTCVRSQLLDGVVSVTGNWCAFAAWKTDGSIVTWGCFTSTQFWSSQPVTIAVEGLW